MILTHTATDSTITAATNAICPISIVYKDKCGKIPKNRFSNIIHTSLKFQKEPSLDDPFWIVGVQTN